MTMPLLLLVRFGGPISRTLDHCKSPFAEYLLKPFNPCELLVCVPTPVSNIEPSLETDNELLKFAGLESALPLTHDSRPFESYLAKYPSPLT